MIINEIYIDAFGKFEKKKISFKNGLNVIYGKNESGKSTVHKFVEAMFFGLFKDYRKRKTYSEDYVKYFPLKGTKYGGSIVYTVNGKQFRLERNLVKGRDQVNIYDNITGEDITKEFYYDTVLKLYTPFLPSEMNRSLYKNTVSIEQLGSTTGEALAGEVADKLVNYAQSKSEISVENVLQSLKLKLNQLGTSKRKNTPIYEIESSIEILKERTNEIIKAMEEVEERTRRIDALKNKIKEALDRKKYLEEHKKAKEYYEAYLLKKEYKEFKLKLKEIEDDILRIKKDYPIDKVVEDFDLKEIKSLKNKYEESYNLKNELYLKKQSFKNNDIRDKIKNIKESIKVKNLYIGLFSIIGTLGIILGIAIKPYFYLLALVFILSLNFYKSKKSLETELIKTEKLLNNQGNDEKELTERIKNVEEQISEIKNRFGNFKDDEISYILEGLEAYLEIKEEEKNLKYLMEKVIPLSKYKETLKKATMYEEYKHLDINIDVYEINSEIENLDNQVEECKIEISRLEGHIENTLEKYPNLSDVENELNFFKKRRDEIYKRQEAIKLAIEIIEKLSGEIHREFAPDLNRCVGKILKEITNQYDNIKIDKNLNIKIESKEYKELLEIEQLSKGTIDQTYFAFRLGLIDILNLENYPVLLDEPFLLYDDERLKNALCTLRGRQILLFTSQKRELNTLDKLGIDYHLIKLDN